MRDKPRRSWRGRIARTAQPSYNGIAADNQGSLRQGMPEVTPVEIRAAVAHSAQEPTEATQGRLNAAPERRRDLRPLGRGGCQWRNTLTASDQTIVACFIYFYLIVMAKHVFTPLGASNHTTGARPDHDYYATDPKALEMLLDLESFNPFIWEPAAGEGHLSNVLKARGYDVRESDLIARSPNIEQLDFFEYEGTWHGDIITNPPYSIAQGFIEHALHVAQPGAKIAMFLRLLFLEGKRRRAFFEAHPPKRVWVSSSRISCAKNGDFTSATNAVAFAWFIWEKGYKGDTVIEWFN